jgi:hypothetical protein
VFNQAAEEILGVSDEGNACVRPENMVSLNRTCLDVYSLFVIGSRHK